VATGSGHENHQGGPAPGRGVLTTAALGPAAEMTMMTAIASAMAMAENQPSIRVRRRPDGGAADGPGGGVARAAAWPGRWAGDAGAGRGGITVSRLLSCSLIWHAPVARVGLRLDRPHRAGSSPRAGGSAPAQPDIN